MNNDGGSCGIGQRAAAAGGIAQLHLKCSIRPKQKLVADANHDGKLSTLEFKGAFRKWFRQWDADKSAALSETELRNGLSQLFRPPDFGGPDMSGQAGKTERHAASATGSKGKARRK